MEDNFKGCKWKFAISLPPLINSEETEKHAANMAHGESARDRVDIF